MRNSSLIFTLAATSVAFQSCIFEDIQPCPDPWKHIEVAFDISECPDASPEGMALFLFPENGGTPWRFDFSGTKGGVIDIPPGNYSVIAYNNDTYRTQILNPDSYSACAFSTPEAGVFDGLNSLTRESIPGGPPEGSETVAKEPQIMWCGSIPTVSVSDNNDLSFSRSETPSDSVSYPILTVPLRQATPSVTVNAEKVGNLVDVNKLCAVLTGMAREYSCSELRPSGKMTTIPFAINRPDPKSESLTGHLMTFGKNDFNIPSYVLIYVWLNDGQKFYYKFDVTEQIRKAPDPLNILIELSPINIPDAIGGEPGQGGMDVGVDGWDFVIIDMES